MRLAVLAAAMAAGTAFADAQIRPWTGKATPPLAQRDLSGQTVDLRDFRGKVVVLNFWATWCQPCREEMPSLERLRQKLEGRPFEVLTVNYGEGARRVAQFLEREKLSLTVLLDSDKEAAAAWRAGGLPMTFVIDARGQVRYWVFGERDWSEGEPLRLVQDLISESAHAGR